MNNLQNMETLTQEDIDQLQVLEAAIEKGLQTFVDVGTALLSIRDERLYRQDYGTFEDYCQERWGIVRRQADRLIQAAEVVENLRPIGLIPSTESQTRPLTNLEPDQQREVWAKVVDTAPNGKVTAEYVQKIVDDYVDKHELVSDADDHEWQSEDSSLVSVVEWEEPPQQQYPAENERVIFTCAVCNKGVNEKLRDHWPESNDEICKNCREKRGNEFTSQVQSYPLTAANHAISDDPDYDGDEWYTPIEYIQAARRVMGGIDCDPASCDPAQEIVQASFFLTKEDDSLRGHVAWNGRIWLNPPYSGTLIKQFVSKLISQYNIGNATQAIILTNNSSDTGWFHDLLSRYPACFTRGRVQFWRPGSGSFAARQGQTLFYLGENTAAFREVFTKFGQVVVKA